MREGVDSAQVDKSEKTRKVDKDRGRKASRTTEKLTEPLNELKLLNLTLEAIKKWREGLNFFLVEIEMQIRPDETNR